MAKRKRHARTKALSMGVALAWYDAIQWTKLKQIADDAADLDESHEAWQQAAEFAEREFGRQGLLVRRVPVDVGSLVAWCKLHNKPLNCDARVEYVLEIARGRGVQ